MKIGRNDPCPCGSGKKYKKCCLNKSEIEFLAEAAFDAQMSLKRDGQIKQCLHPNKAECTDNHIQSVPIHIVPHNSFNTSQPSLLKKVFTFSFPYFFSTSGVI